MNYIILDFSASKPLIIYRNKQIYIHVMYVHVWGYYLLVINPYE